jgi:hypothetical protein
MSCLKTQIKARSSAPSLCTTPWFHFTSPACRSWLATATKCVACEPEKSERNSLPHLRKRKNDTEKDRQKRPIKIRLIKIRLRLVFFVLSSPNVLSLHPSVFHPSCFLPWVLPCLFPSLLHSARLPFFLARFACLFHSSVRRVCWRRPALPLCDRVHQASWCAGSAHGGVPPEDMANPGLLQAGRLLESGRRARLALCEDPRLALCECLCVNGFV